MVRENLIFPAWAANCGVQFEAKWQILPGKRSLSVSESLVQL
jgi:hypothetical protein